MNYDIPLEHYNGATAYEISKRGYAEHISQHYTWFTDWLLGKNNDYTLATQIKTYSPLNYGLYYSKVGYENKDGDMFYNIPTETIDETTEELEINDEIQDTENNNNITSNKENNHIYIYFIVGIGGILVLMTIIIIWLKKKH